MKFNCIIKKDSTLCYGAKISAKNVKLGKKVSRIAGANPRLDKIRDRIFVNITITFESRD
jgi:hypothetical protein